MWRQVVIAVILAVLFTAPGEAGISRTLSYQAILRDDGGQLVDGEYDLTFTIYERPHSVYVAIWDETHADVEIENGVFDVMLGSQTTLGDIFTGRRWISIGIDGGPALEPYIELTGTPYAFRSAVADSAIVAGQAGASGWIVEGDDIHCAVAGNVGIGTSDPVSKLSIKGPSPESVHDAQLDIEGSDETGALGTGAGVAFAGHDGNTRRTWGTIRGLKEDDIVGTTAGFLAFATRHGNGGGPYERLRVTSTGDVGIGEDDPLSHLHLRTGDIELPAEALSYDQMVIEDDDAILGLYSNQSGANGSGIVLGEIDGGVLSDKWSIVRETSSSQCGLRFSYGTEAFYGNNEVAMYLSSDGAVGIGTGSNTPEEALTVRGNILVLSESTGDPILELGEGLDYAEGFDVSTEADIEPGTVLVIDPMNAGELAVSTHAYDSKVAGIVAGANALGSGVRLGAGQFEQDVALAGRVYCNVDAATGSIAPGDLLTTSSLPGYAMKATDRDRAQGAILGKAMEALPAGCRGKVLVLVTLQ